MIKTNFMMKKKKNAKKKYDSILYSELAPLTCDITCSKL